MQFVQMGFVGMKKQKNKENNKRFPFLEEGSPEKKSYASAMVVELTDKMTL